MSFMNINKQVYLHELELSAEIGVGAEVGAEILSPRHLTLYKLVSYGS